MRFELFDIRAVECVNYEMGMRKLSGQLLNLGRKGISISLLCGGEAREDLIYELDGKEQF